MTVRIASWLALAAVSITAIGCSTLPAPDSTASLCPATLPAASDFAASGFRAIDDGDPPRPATLPPGATGRFLSVRFSDGPPEEQAWLAPGSEDGDILQWSFSPTAGRQTYLTCGYGNGVPALTRPLDRRQCTVRLGDGDAVVDLSCR